MCHCFGTLFSRMRLATALMIFFLASYLRLIGRFVWARRLGSGRPTRCRLRCYFQLHRLTWPTNFVRNTYRTATSMSELLLPTTNWGAPCCGAMIHQFAFLTR
ncbi:hypothetical protein GE09DRAFT_666487 [Coniochaeta sp. 2T2.1]|nr:hypothetical protein GE09DRAFT_666487 [Coniochaeta sp. 2T2.1]